MESKTDKLDSKAEKEQIQKNLQLANDLKRATRGEPVKFSDDPEEQEALQFLAQLTKPKATKKVPGKD